MKDGKELLEKGGMNNFNQLKPYLKKRGIENSSDLGEDYIKILKKDKKIKDKKIRFLDTNEEYYWYQDKIFIQKKRNVYNARGDFLFRSLTNMKKKKISDEEHCKNIKSFDLSSVNVINCIDTNRLVFIRDPFSEYTSDSRHISHYIKWKYNLSPNKLLFDILDHHGLCEKCDKCGKPIKERKYDVITCTECNKNMKIRDPIEITISKKQLTHSILNGVCPLCSKSVNSLQRHFCRSHYIRLIDFIYLNIDDNEECLCGNKLNKFKEFKFLLDYNTELDNTFYDFDINKDFVYFKKTCSQHSCTNKNIYVKFKKIIKFYLKERYPLNIRKTIEKIRHNYHNIYKYSSFIDGLINNFRELSKIKTIFYKNNNFIVYSSYEEYGGKYFIDNGNVKKFYSNGETLLFYDFVYKDVDGVGNRYVPDFYIQDNDDNEYIIEIKSLWTFGYDFSKNQIIDIHKIFSNMKKFYYCDMQCKDKNIDFFIIIENQWFNYRELKNETERRTGRRIE